MEKRPRKKEHRKPGQLPLFLNCSRDPGSIYARKTAPRPERRALRHQRALDHAPARAGRAGRRGRLGAPARPLARRRATPRGTPLAGLFLDQMLKSPFPRECLWKTSTGKRVFSLAGTSGEFVSTGLDPADVLRGRAGPCVLGRHSPWRTARPHAGRPWAEGAPRGYMAPWTMTETGSNRQPPVTG